MYSNKNRKQEKIYKKYDNEKSVHQEKPSPRESKYMRWL